MGNRETFDNLQKWIDRVNQIRENCGMSVPVPGVVIANKTDLESRAEVKPKRGKELAANYMLDFFETSALSHDDVEKPFIYIAEMFHKMYMEKMDAIQEEML